MCITYNSIRYQRSQKIIPALIASTQCADRVVHSSVTYHIKLDIIHPLFQHAAYTRYLHSPGVPQYDDPSSEHRLTRIKQLHPAYNKEDILAYLGDTKDDQYPIYRTAASPDGAATIATGTYWWLAVYHIVRASFRGGGGRGVLPKLPFRNTICQLK